jgi:hypothetical protein
MEVKKKIQNLPGVLAFIPFPYGLPISVFDYFGSNSSTRPTDTANGYFLND